MKFMKLGSKPDTFYTSESLRSVSSEVSTDIIILVNDTRFLLHKFPLLSKCLRLQKLCSDSPETTQQKAAVELADFPGGAEAFELCAKFCYGITVTLSAYNLVAARCAAEYLQMTEEVEKGNLVYKIEVFLYSCLLQGWRDSITTLQSTKAFPLWCEDLGITSRCIDAISSKVLNHPSKVSLSHSYLRRVGENFASCDGAESQRRSKANVEKGWWAEDIAELGIDLYWRTMIAIKSGGKVPACLIGDAFRVYAARWLPNIMKCKAIERQSELGYNGDGTSKHRLLLESIISLLPAEKGCVSSRFLSQLLKAANVLKASASSKIELARRLAIQLEDAAVGDLLIPCVASTSVVVYYDVDLVLTILEQFMIQVQSPPTSPPRVKGGSIERRRSRSAENVDFAFQERRRSSSPSHSSKLKVARLVDGYLQEIARDVNLPLSKFVAVAESIPEFARLDHDDLYKAIDIYLKAHPGLEKSERKRLCRILDCKKLSVETCMSAAQNELLPLRVLVQVLFHEHARTTMAGGQVPELPSNLKALLAAQGGASLSKAISASADDQWSSVSGLKSPPSKVKLGGEMLDSTNGKSPMINKAFSIVHNRPRRMLSKLWSSRNGSDHQKN